MWLADCVASGMQGPKAVRKYVQECKDLHFDAVELPDACADMLAEKEYLHLLDDLQEVLCCASPLYWERLKMPVKRRASC